MGDYCFLRGLRGAFCCVIFFSFFWESASEDASHQPPSSLKMSPPKVLDLKRKLLWCRGSFFIELCSLARHAVKAIVASFISCADETHLIAHLHCRVDRAIFSPHWNGYHWLPCWPLLLECEFQRQNLSHSLLYLFGSPVPIRHMAGTQCVFLFEQIDGNSASHIPTPEGITIPITTTLI